MRSGKLFLATGFIIGAVIALAGCGSPAAAPPPQKIVIKAAHTTSSDYPYQIGFEAMAKSLAAKTAGKVEMQVFPGGQLGGNEREVIDSLQLGTVTMTVVNGAVVSNITPKADVFNLPFIFSDYQHLYRAVDGEPGRIVARELEAKNLKVLAWYVNPERYIFTSRQPVTRLDDLKGQRIRVTQSPVSIETFNALGAQAVPMAYGELYAALDKGIVDGGENDWFGIRGLKFYEVAGHISLTGHFMVACPVLVSAKWFAAQPADIQKALTEAALDGQKAMREYMDKELAAIPEQVKAKGGKVYKVEDLVAWRAAVAPVYTKFEGAIGRELIEMTRNLR